MPQKKLNQKGIALNKNMDTQQKVRELALTAMLTAIIIVLVFFLTIGYIPLGFTKITIIHIPVIIGSLTLGPKKGGFLGAVFGATSLIKNTFEPTLTSFVFSPFYSGGTFASLIICFVPRILVGVVPYFIYKLIKNKSKWHSSVNYVISGVAGSLTNTILVCSMIVMFFGDKYAAIQDKTASELYVAMAVLIGTNGIPEAIGAAIITLGVMTILRKTTKTNRE